MTRPIQLALTVVVAISACRDRAPAGDAWAVGAHIGGGSMLIPRTRCTYEASAEVAELVRDQDGEVFMAKLIGPGTIKEICPKVTRVHEVLEPTGLRIDGPAALQVGTTGSEAYRVTPLAGRQELRGVHPGGAEPAWSLGADCAGVAELAPVRGAQDTGREVTRALVPHKSGSCTIMATALGITGSKAVRIE